MLIFAIQNNCASVTVMFDLYLYGGLKPLECTVERATTLYFQLKMNESYTK